MTNHFWRDKRLTPPVEGCDFVMALYLRDDGAVFGHVVDMTSHIFTNHKEIDFWEFSRNKVQRHLTEPLPQRSVGMFHTNPKWNPTTRQYEVPARAARKRKRLG